MKVSISCVFVGCSDSHDNLEDWANHLKGHANMVGFASFTPTVLVNFPPNEN